MAFLYEAVEYICGTSPGNGNTAVWVGITTASGALIGVGMTTLFNYLTKKKELAHGVQEENRKLKVTRLEALHEMLAGMITISADLMSGYVDFKSRGSKSSKEIAEIIAPSSKILGKMASLQGIYANEFETEMKKIQMMYILMIEDANKYLANSAGRAEDIMPRQLETVSLCQELAQKIEQKIQAFLT